MCGLIPAEATGQTPASSPSSVHFYVCPSGELSQPDRTVLATLHEDLGAAVARAGGVVFAPARPATGPGSVPGCANLDEVVGALEQYGRAPRPAVFVLLDSLTLATLLRRDADLVGRLDLRPMNLRLFTRPLHIFESEGRSAQGAQTPTVGVYADQEIAPATLAPLLAGVLEKPVRIVPFQNVAEMARCLAEGQFDSSFSRCPAQIGWAVVVEQDASLTVEAFTRAYQESAKRAPTPVVPLGRPLGIHASSAGAGIEVIVSPSGAIPTLGGSAPPPQAAVPMAAVPRTEGPLLVEQQAREPRAESAGYLAAFFALLPRLEARVSAGSGDAADDRLRYPYPIVLTNQDPQDALLRTVLSDSYLRVLNNAAIGSPCTAVAERLHRAYLFNAYLNDPNDASKKLSLGSELVLAAGGSRNLTELFDRLQLSADLGQWPRELAAAGGPTPACPSVPNLKIPEERVLFSIGGSAAQYNALEHLRRGNLDGAAACLRRAMAESATPQCHRIERGTYWFYYNPYFYFAVQQVSGDPAVR